MGEVECRVCGKKFRKITITHLKKHNMTFEEYEEKFPEANIVPDDVKEKRSEMYSGEGNPYYGEKHSEETRKKLRESHLGNTQPKEVRKKISGTLSGENNHAKKPEIRKKISEANSGKGNPMYNKSHSEEAREKISENNYISEHTGEEHPNWKGGKSFEPYPPEFREALKEKVRKRDNRTCQLCGADKNTKGEEEVKMVVHHIDGDKQNNSSSNLVTLCSSCNSKIEYWGVRPQFKVN